MMNKTKGIVLFVLIFVIFSCVFVFKSFNHKDFDPNTADGVSRINYVDSLIGSTLSIESLEKLVAFVEYPREDIASDKAKDFLFKLRRELFDKYPDNYISQALFNQKVLRWGKMPIKYGFYFDTKVPPYYIDEIKNAFNTWEAATEKTVSFKFDNANPDIIVRFSENAEKEFEEGKLYVLAYTVPLINFSNLDKMVITFYPKNFSGGYYTENQIYNTALHEIAHALGVMGHSSNRKNVLYISKDSESHIENKKRILTRGDINTIKLLYKTKPDITNIMPNDSEYIPYLIAGGKDDIFYAKYKEAKNYIMNAPNLPNGYVDMAANYVSVKEYNKAIKYLKKAYQLSTDDEPKKIVLYNLAVAYYKKGNYNAALNSLKEMHIDEKNAEYMNFMAEIYLKLGRDKEAIKIYKNLVFDNPRNSDFAVALANIYIEQKHYLKARSVLKRYFKNNPEEKSSPKFDSYGIIKLFL